MSESVTVNPRGMVRHILKNYEVHELEDALTEMIGALRLPSAPPAPLVSPTRFTVDDVLRDLQSLKVESKLELGATLFVSPIDAIASVTIDFVLGRLPSDAVIGDAEKVLHNALFWLQLFSRARATQPEPSQEEGAT